MENYIGSLCPHCGQEITAADAVKVCPACGIAHHAGCWNENQGCTTFGCSQQRYQTPPAEPVPAPEAPADQKAAPVQPASPRFNFLAYFLTNLIPILTLLAGTALLWMGLDIYIPSGYLSSYDVVDYVGGDAYNYIMEASLRGGQIAGAMITKAVYTAVGLLISCVSVLKLRLPGKDA